MERKAVITARDLVKVYRNSDVRALQGVSLSIRERDIFGLLGPNGAGKTTTISILGGLMKPTSGSVTLLGKELSGHYAALKQHIGIVPQEIALYPDLTALENLSFIASMSGLHGEEKKRRIREFLERMDLWEKRGRQLGTFSSGMKRRVNLIAGIMHRPALLFLDEPTVGIDVQSRRVILDHLKELRDDGMTIIYTSHYLEEAESLCNRIAIIDNGVIIAEGDPAEMIGSRPEYADLESIFIHLTGRRVRDI